MINRAKCPNNIRNGILRVKRRELLAGMALGTAFAAGNAYLWNMAKETAPEVYGDNVLGEADSFRGLPNEELLIVDSEAPMAMPEMGIVNRPQAGGEKTDRNQAATSAESEAASAPDAMASMEERVRNFENDFSDDILLPESEWPLLESVILRLKRVQRVVGHGHFNVLDFDQLLLYARSYNSIGEFTKQELDFVEKIFFTRASEYGFMGHKVTDQLTAQIPDAEIVKVPYSGHYLFKGESLNYYEKLKKDIGPSVILTSGIRSNVKQLHLFLSKASASNYNMSKASRSLAPPGHSYHGIGDFDVGRVGWGAENFTNQFARTDEFKRMQDLGYVQIRYTEDNRLGVRFEPWHIKVV